MSVSLTNFDGKIAFSYISGNGILTSNNNSQINKISTITPSELSDEIQTQLSSIDDINDEILTIDTSINNISRLITDIQTDISAIETSISNLDVGGNTSGISLDDVVPFVNNMISKDVSNFAKQWYTAANAGQPNIINIACSGDGKYIFVCPWSVGSAQFSSDYGENWITPSNVSANIWSCAMNLDGKYIVLADNNNYKVSTDYGSSFSIPTTRPYSLNQATLSATGKYIACACANNQGLHVSSNYGDTWTQRETSTYTWNSVAMSLDGSVVYGCSTNGLIKKTIDYGASWTTMYTNVDSTSIKTICCSSDGKYVMATLDTSSKIMVSLNYGNTFSLVGDTASYYTSAMSKNGMYMIATINGSALKYSINYGATWSTLNNNKFTAAAMSYNGESIYNVSPYNKVNISRNTGNNAVINSMQPTIATTGSHYFDSVANKLYIYNGTDWKSITFS